MNTLAKLSERQADFAASCLPSIELPPRQRQTLKFMILGHTEKQIANRLSISRHTVHVYVKAIYLGFGINSRGDLLAGTIAHLISRLPE